MRKDLAISVLGHTLVLSLVALGARAEARAARTPAQEPPSRQQACSDAIARDLEPYHDLARSIWVNDALFQYVQIGKIYNGLIDKDPSLKAAIDSFKHGKARSWDVRELLLAKADQVAGFSNSLVRFYGKPFYWHYPVPHIGERATLDTYYTISDGGTVFELRVDLGGSLQSMNDQLEAGAARIMGQRIGVKLARPGTLSQEVSSDSDYLHRNGGIVPLVCLQDYDARVKAMPLKHAEPFDFEHGPEYRASSLGVSDGHPVSEYPQSEFTGGNPGGGGTQDTPNPTHSESQASAVPELPTVVPSDAVLVTTPPVPANPVAQPETPPAN